MLQIDRAGEEGYFTLEAAVIGSISCFLILFVLVVSVYFYDVGVSASYIKEVVAQLSLDTDGENTKTEKLYKNELKKRLVLAQIKECQITVKSNIIVGKVCVAVKFPIPVISKWLGETWKNTVSVQMEKGNTTDRIRRWRMLE